MSLRYFEFDSSYRDRTSYPNPGQFLVPWTRGIPEDPLKMDDPVALGSSIRPPPNTIFSWNNFALNDLRIPVIGPANQVLGQTAAQTEAGNLANDNVTRDVLQVRVRIISGSGRNWVIQQAADDILSLEPGHYEGCLISSHSPYEPRFQDRTTNEFASQNFRVNNTVRIMKYTPAGPGQARILTDAYLEFLAPAGAEPSAVYSIYTMGKAGVSSVTGGPTPPGPPPGPVTLTTVPPVTSELFVPRGSKANNAYVGRILSNDSRRQYRRIQSYDGMVRLLDVDTRGAPLPLPDRGPIDAWEPYDALSIRLVPPGSYPIIGWDSQGGGLRGESGIVVGGGAGGSTTFTFTAQAGCVPVGDGMFIQGPYRNTPAVLVAGIILRGSTGTVVETTPAVPPATQSTYTVTNLVPAIVGGLAVDDQIFVQTIRTAENNYLLRPSHSSFRLKSGTLKEGMFIDIGRGNAYSNRGIGNFVAQTPGVPATLTLNLDESMGINVGDKIRTLPESPLQLSDDTTVVGFTVANATAHLSSQVDAQGVPLPTTNNVVFSIEGGAAKNFSVQMTAASDGSTMVIDDFVTATPEGNALSCVPQYSNAYLGFKVVGRGVTWVQTGNPEFITQGRITGYDPAQRQFTVDPPLNSSLFGADNPTVTFLPPRESRQILRYAWYTGQLERPIRHGTYEIQFPQRPSQPPFRGRASPTPRGYVGLYVTLGDDQGRYQTRMITQYDPETRTARVDYPWAALPWQTDPEVFRGMVGTLPPLPALSGTINSTVADGSFTTTTGTTEILVGRRVLSLTNVALPDGSYVRSATPTGANDNWNLILAGPDGRLLSLGGVVGAADILLGSLSGSQFEIYSATTTREFLSPLPLHFGRPNTVWGRQAVANSVSYEGGTSMTSVVPASSEQQARCFMVFLVNLVLPNAPILGSRGQGGKIAFHPYIYVDIENVSDSSSSRQINLWSNNPHSRRATFRVPITDINDPAFVPFIRVTGGSQRLTIKMRPSDSLRITIRLQNGEIFKTIQEENFPPEPANPYKQLSALFGFLEM